MKHIVALSFAILLLTCSSKIDSGWDVTIHGKVANPQTGTITLREVRSDGAGKTETITLKADKTYEKKIHLTEPGNYYLNFYDQQVLNIILNKSNMEINVDGSDRQGFAEIKGSPEHDLISKAQALQMEQKQSPALADLQQKYSEAAAIKDEAKMQQIRDQYMTVLKQESDKMAALLLSQPASIAVMDLLLSGSFLEAENYINVYDDAAQKLNKAYPNALFAKDFQVMVQKLKALSVGSKAPEIALPNPDGKIIKLSSLQGKYVLVDFWAKWCGPCRRENPNVVKAYRRFKSKGFEVFGVSLDRTKEDWVGAIKQDSLTWTHVSDLKYFDSQAAHDYNINAIPFSILLDKNGVIIAKNLRGAALEEKLEQVFGK